MTCPHNFSEAESAVYTEGLCPICLLERVRYLERVIKTMNTVSYHQTDRLFPAHTIGDLKFPQMRMHPLTCGKDSAHTPLYPYYNGERVQLICRDCDYTQNNAGPCEPHGV